MASGEVVGSILMSIAPGVTRADPGVRQSATSLDNFPILSFDDTIEEFWDFLVAIEGYAGGGLTVEIAWTSATATTSTTLWGVAFRRLDDDNQDIDLAHTYDENTTASTAPSAAGEIVYDTIAFTHGADMDSVADGERCMMRVNRNDAGANMAGDAQLLWPAIVIRET